jgi:hypothetical protein
MATVNSDFVDVQLSPAGITAVGANGSVRITAGRMSYVFTPGSRVKVLTSEWAKILSKKMLRGQTILQLAPALVAGAAAGTPAKAQLKTLQAEEAKLQTQIAEGK